MLTRFLIPIISLYLLVCSGIFHNIFFFRRWPGSFLRILFWLSLLYGMRFLRHFVRLRLLLSLLYWINLFWTLYHLLDLLGFCHYLRNILLLWLYFLRWFLFRRLILTIILLLLWICGLRIVPPIGSSFQSLDNIIFSNIDLEILFPLTTILDLLQNFSPSHRVLFDVMLEPPNVILKLCLIHIFFPVFILMFIHSDFIVLCWLWDHL